MPTYEYECDACGLVFEEFQSIAAEPMTVCRTPGCKGKVRRLLSGGAGFLFKGSGFYITDYRSESYQKAAKAETAPAASPATDSKSSSSSSAGGDAKPSAVSSTSEKSSASKPS